MGFLGDLFSGKGPTTHTTAEEMRKATIAAQKGCWQVALWFAAKALERTPDSPEARELFKTSLANTQVAFLVMLEPLREKQAAITSLLQRRHMTGNEAADVADAMIDSCYMDEMINCYQESAKEAIGRQRRVPESDLELGRAMAVCLGDVRLPDQKSHIQWKSLLSPESDSLLTSGIAAHKEALAILLQTNTPSDWPETCRRLCVLWRQFRSEQAMAAEFERMAREQVSNAEFQRYRNMFENNFAKSAARLLQMKRRAREPV